MKKLIIFLGMMTFGVSFFYSGSNIGSLLFLFGLGAAVSVVVVPIAAMILNPIAEFVLDSGPGQRLGKYGRLIFRIVFTIPEMGTKSQQTKSKANNA